MKYIFVILFCLSISNEMFADYDHSQTKHPYEYDPLTFLSVPGGYDLTGATGHNQNAGLNNGAFISVAVKDKGAYDLSCYDWYVEVVTVFQVSNRPPKYGWKMESIGSTNLNKISDPLYGEIVNPAPQKSGMERQVDEHGEQFVYINIDFDDFSENLISSANYSLRLVVVKKGGGICGEELIGEEFFPVGDWAFSRTYIMDFTPPTPGIGITVPNLTMCFGAILNNSVNAIITNATGPYTITLANAAEAGDAAFLPAYATVAGDVITVAPGCPAGSYTVKATVTDGAGTAETTFKFTVNEVPDLAITPTPGAAICDGKTLSLSVTDNNGVASDYRWSVAGAGIDLIFNSNTSFQTYKPGNNNITGLMPAGGNMTYTVTAKSAAGCDASKPVGITVNPVPDVDKLTASSNTICLGESVTLTAALKPTSAVPAASWTWVNPLLPGNTSNRATVTPTSAGNHIYKVKALSADGCESGEFTASVTVNPKPVLSVTSQPKEACYGNLVDLTTAVINSGGVTIVPANTKYYSDATCTTPVPNPGAVAAGPYWVVQATASGCSDTVELTATVRPALNPALAASAEICAGSSLALTATPAGMNSYVWKDGATTLATTSTNTYSVIPAAAGSKSYQVTVTDDKGCSATSTSVPVTVNPLPTVTISLPTPATVCAGTTINLQANVAGATGALTYTWGSGVTVDGVDRSKATAVVQNGTSANTYTLSVTDAKMCTGISAPVQATGVYFSGSLAANPLTYEEGTHTSVNLTAHVTVNGEAGLTINNYTFEKILPLPVASIQNGASSTCMTGPQVSATTYQVICTDNKYSCKDTFSIGVGYKELEMQWDLASVREADVCDAAGAVDVFLTAQVQFGVQPYTYSWNSLPTGITYRTSNDTLYITKVDAGMLGVKSAILTVRDYKGTVLTKPLRLNVHVLPVVQINGAVSGDLTVCQGETLTLTATGGNTVHQWTAPTASSGSSRSVNTSVADPIGKEYTVVGTSKLATYAGGMLSCSDSATRKVIINVSPVAGITKNTADTVCPQTEVTFTATGGVNAGDYTWTGSGVSGNGAQKVVPNANGIYTVKVTNASGCSDTKSDTVRQYTPEVITLTPNLRVCETEAMTGITLTASGLTGGVYSWNGGDLSNATGAIQTVTPTATTTYTVDGTDVHGCTVAQKSVTVTVDKMPTLLLAKTELSACGNVKLYDAINVAGTTAGVTFQYANNPGFTSPQTLTSATSITITGTYYIRAVKGECKTDGQSVTVNVLVAPVLDVRSTWDTCAPATVDLTKAVLSSTTFLSSDLTYWANSALTIPVVDSSAINTTGSYYIKGHIEGCTDVSKKVDVKINPKPTVLTTDPTVCAPRKGDLTATTTGSTAGLTWSYYSHDFSTAITAAEARKVDAGTYQLIGKTSAGCLDTAAVTVKINPQPAFDVTTPPAACQGETVDLSTLVTATDGGSHAYSYYSNAACTNTVSHLIATVGNAVPYYIVGKMAVTGCTDTMSVPVTINKKPQINAIPSKVVCEGKALDVTAISPDGASVGFTWRRPDGTTSPGAHYTETMNTPGTFVYRVIAALDGCLDSLYVSVDVPALPTVTIAGSPAEGCQNEQITLTANPLPAGRTYTYSWNGATKIGSTNQATAILTPTNNVFSVTVTDNYGCVSALSPAETVTVHTLTAGIKLSVGGTNIVCGATKPIGSTVSIDASSTVNGQDYTFVQVVGGVRTVIQAKSAVPTCAVTLGNSITTYRVIVESPEGCLDSASCNVGPSGAKLEILPTQNARICYNSTDFSAAAARLIATAQGGETDYTYTWTVAPADAANGLQISSSPAGATTGASTATITSLGTLSPGTYTLECKVEDALGTEASTSVTLVIEALPVVTLVSSATLPVAVGTPVTWTAGPTGAGFTYEFINTTNGRNDSKGIQPGNTYAHALSADTCYKVVVVSDGGCRDTSAEICATVDKSSLATVKTQDVVACSGAGTVDLKATITGRVTSYQWRQIEGSPNLSLTNATTAQASVDISTAVVGNTYKFEISVNGGGAKDTAELTIRQSPKITNLEAIDSCGGKIRLLLTANNANSIDWKAVSPGIAWSEYGSVDKTDCTFKTTNASVTSYTIAAIVKNGQCQDSVAISGHVVNFTITLTLATKDTCGKLDIIDVSHSGGGAGTSGKFKLEYIYTPFGGTAVNLVHSYNINASEGPEIPVRGTGRYRLVKVYDESYPACAISLKDSVLIDTVPSVKINEECLALHKDSARMLNVVNLSDYSYIWNVKSGNGTTGTWGAPASGDGTTGTSINCKMGDTDLQYIITAKTKTLLACKGTDTLVAYRIPDAPVIDIDTVNDRYHAQVTWSAQAFADGYTLRSRRWDPYCLTAAYTGDYTYKAELTNSNTTSWIEPSMDSLKFFYVTAGRNVCGTWYNSLSSVDTVGYKLDSIKKQAATSTLASNNMITWMFNMSGKGVSISDDLFARGGNLGSCNTYHINVVRKWVNIPNATSAADFAIYTTPNSLHCIVSTLPEFTTGNNPNGNVGFALRVGDAYQFEAKRATQLLQYGRLETVEQRIDTVAVAGQNNVFACPLHKAYLGGIEDILMTEITKDVISVVRMWDFATQTWLHYVKYNPLHDMNPIIPPVAGSEGPGTSIPVRPADALQIEFIKGNPLYPDYYIWK